jgi:hypothetical protein
MQMRLMKRYIKKRILASEISDAHKGVAEVGLLSSDKA